MPPRTRSAEKNEEPSKKNDSSARKKKKSTVAIRKEAAAKRIETIKKKRITEKFIPLSMSKAMEPSSKSSKERILIKYAIFSRLLVLFLTLLWRSFLQPYDTSAALNPPCLHRRDISPEASPPLLVVTNPVSKTLEKSVVWDSVYFLRITECGYEYEQTYAFLPLLPFFISLPSRTVFAPLVPLIGLRGVMVLSGYVVTNLAFVLAAIYLFRTLNCNRGVGFLRYFQFKQLPNFLLASPIMSLAVSSIISYMKNRHELFISLGFQASEKEKRSSARLYSLKDALEPAVITSSSEGNRDIRQRKPSRKKDVTITTNATETSTSPEAS